MTTIFLDDSPCRQKTFRSHIPSALIVSTAAECIAALSAYPTITELWLDHDLGGEEYTDSGRDDTGMAVVRWIIEHRPKIGTVIIHSLNHGAARSMHVALELEGYACSLIPFTSVNWSAMP